MLTVYINFHISHGPGIGHHTTMMVGSVGFGEIPDLRSVSSRLTLEGGQWWICINIPSGSDRFICDALKLKFGQNEPGVYHQKSNSDYSVTCCFARNLGNNIAVKLDNCIVIESATMSFTSVAGVEYHEVGLPEIHSISVMPQPSGDVDHVSAASCFRCVIS